MGLQCLFAANRAANIEKPQCAKQSMNHIKFVAQALRPSA
jgi:hypothetical protein